MSLSLTEQVLDRQSGLRSLAIDSSLALAVGSLLAMGVTYGWWTLVFGIPVLCAFAFFAVHARQETLMVAYVFVLTLLACLQVSLLIEISPGSYAMVGLGRYALMGGLVVWGLVVFHKYPSSLKTFDFAWIALLVMVAISIVYSVDRSITIARGITLAALFLSIFALVRTFKQDPRGSVRIVNALLLASACIFVPGLFLLFGDPELMSGTTRFSGIFASPSAAAGVCCMILPLAIWGALHQTDPRTRFLCFLLSPVLLASLLLSQTRNAVGAFVIGMLGTYILKNKKALYLLVPVLVLAVMFGVSMVIDNSESLQSTEFYTNYLNREGTLVTITGRLYLWEEAFREIEERPITGYGFGTGGVVLGMADLPKIVSYESQQLASYSTALPMLSLNKTEGLNAHNSYIEICLELGAIGLILCLVLLGCVTLEIVRARQEDLPLPCGTLAPYLAGCFIAGLVNQSCEAALFSAGSVICIVFWFVVAAILCLRSDEISIRKRKPRRLASYFGSQLDYR